MLAEIRYRGAPPINPSISVNAGRDRCYCQRALEVALNTLCQPLNPLFSCFGWRAKEKEKGLKVRIELSIPEYQRQALVNRTEEARISNLKSISRLFPEATADEFVLSCSPKQTTKFHALFADILFQKQAYAKARTYMDVAASEFVRGLDQKDITPNDISAALSRYIAEIMLNLLCANADEEDRERISAGLWKKVVKIGELFDRRELNGLAKSIDKCFYTMVEVEGTFTWEMQRRGYSDTSMKLTIADFFATSQNTYSILFRTVFSYLNYHLDYQDRLRQELGAGETTLLNKIVIECLRLDPPISEFGSEHYLISTLARDSTITGYLHLDPGEFDPDSITQVPDCPRKLPFLPFGFGPNACPFSKWVMDGAKSLVSTIYRTYHIEVNFLS